MAKGFKVEYEGEAYLGRKNIEKSMSFGMESKKINKASAHYRNDYLGVGGKLSSGDSKNGLHLEGNGSVLHLDYGYDKDYTQKIPKIKVYSEANLANMKAEAGITKSGMEHKLAELEVKAFGVSGSAEGGGKAILPKTKAEAYTIKPSASVGFDDLSVKMGKGSGPSASVEIDSGKKNKAFEAGVNKSSFGTNSAEVSGIGSISSNGEGGLKFDHDIGLGSLSDYSDYKKSLTGKSGEQKGSIGDIYSSKWRTSNLVNEAEKQHKKNEKDLKRIDGKNGFFSNRTNNSIADKSRGYFDDLNNAIDQAKIQKNNIDSKLSNLNPDSKEAKKLSNQSQKMGDDINHMTNLRDSLGADRDKANSNLNRSVGSEDVKEKGTSQIVKDAKNNSRDFENDLNKHGLGKNVAESSVGVCESRNELNGRINSLDRQANLNNNDIDNIKQARDNYLNDKSMTLKDAIDKNDPKVAEYNDNEAKLRNENSKLRGEKGECEKALLETDKNFMPRKESKPYEDEGRKLKADSIDNKNEQAAKDDEIANYCNNKGIVKDSEGNYKTPDNQPDEGLQNLLNDKQELQKKDDDIKSKQAENDKQLAQSEKNGKSSAYVREKDGHAEVKTQDINYNAHAQDNKNLRDDKQKGTKDNDNGDNSKSNEKLQENNDKKMTKGSSEEMPNTKDSKMNSEKGSSDEMQKTKDGKIDSEKGSSKEMPNNNVRDNDNNSSGRMPKKSNSKPENSKSSDSSMKSNNSGTSHNSGQSGSQGSSHNSGQSM